MNSPELLKRLLKSVAKKRELSYRDVQRILAASFEFQAKVMKNKCDRENLEFPSVRVPYWGIFYCADYTRDRLNRLNKRQNGDDINRHPDREDDKSVS